MCLLFAVDTKNPTYAGTGFCGKSATQREQLFYLLASTLFVSTNYKLNVPTLQNRFIR